MWKCIYKQSDQVLQQSAPFGNYYAKPGNSVISWNKSNSYSLYRSLCVLNSHLLSNVWRVWRKVTMAILEHMHYHDEPTNQHFSRWFTGDSTENLNSIAHCQFDLWGTNLRWSTPAQPSKKINMLFIGSAIFFTLHGNLSMSLSWKLSAHLHFRWNILSKG